MPKLLLVLVIICLSTLSSIACSNPTLSGPERLCLDKNGFYLGSADKEGGCLNNISQMIEIISSPSGANPEITQQNSDGNDVKIRFDKVGFYTIRYTYLDDPTCENVSPCVKEVVTEVILPEASFAVDSILVCKNEKLIVDINFLNTSNANATVTSSNILRNVSAESNGVGTFISDFAVSESFTLFITKVEDNDLNCIQIADFDSLKVIVFDEPSAKFISKECNAKEEYSMVFELQGGDGTYELLTPEIGTLSGNILTTNFRPSGELFTFSFNSGPTCGIKEIQEQDVCDCINNAGEMENKSLAACASDEITVSHDKTNLEKRPFDSIIYVLHNSDQKDIGAVFDKSYIPVFNLPSEELADSQLYVSAVVGPLTIEDFDLDKPGICLDISFGAKVKWFSKDDFSISGKLEVCANEMNRMYTVDIAEPLKRPSTQFWETSEGSGAVLGSQNSERIFLSFPSATSNSTLYYHSDFRPTNSDTLICRTTDSIDISVDGLVSAPEESNIILWPGNIFASTSDGPCYQWGFVNKFGNFAVNSIPGANEKYFFSDENITQSILEERGYFVAIYDTPNCEFSLNNCNSIVFYNKNLLPSLNQGDRDDFSLNIAPNPNDGTFRLELKGSYRGEYRIDVISDIGQRVADYKVEKLYDRSIRDIELSHLPDGMYIIVISNEFGKKEIIKTIITK
ncbi:T9SS type A sorting domain-containing protein [Portibacter lacus]|uniref:T9SS type A sorting domain-containing protein n=1 Tax=Portibacter lacus TaxID=1099794 RepID=UPI001F4325DB|nr:T9SS type A sorting domain-containing protein [Portibacter lacus]